MNFPLILIISVLIVYLAWKLMGTGKKRSLNKKNLVSANNGTKNQTMTMLMNKIQVTILLFMHKKG